MKFLIAITLLLALTAANKVSSKDIESLMKTQWGNVFVTMAQLQIQSGNPIEDLLNEIRKLIEEDNAKLDFYTNAYNVRSTEHTQQVNDLNGRISRASGDIANSHQLIDGTLKPRILDLENRIRQNDEAIKLDHQRLEEAAQQRKEQQEFTDAQVAAGKEYTAAFEEAIAKVNELNSGDTSLIQVKQVQKQLKKLTDKVAKGSNQSWFKALVQLATSEFADTSMVDKVLELLRNLQQNIADHVQKEVAANEQGKKDYAELVAKTTKDIEDKTQENKESSQQIAETNAAITATEGLIRRLEADVVQYKSDLQKENDSFDAATKVWEALEKQLNQEIAACEQTLKVLEEGFSKVAGWVNDRAANGNKLFDEAHGDKIKVQDYDYQS